MEHINTESPDLFWVYLEYTDDMGYRYGDSEQFYNSITIIDQQIGILSKAMGFRKNDYGENWQIFVTSDHGRNKETGKVMEKEILKVYINTENGFKNSINDHYKMVKRVKSLNNAANMDLSQYPSNFYEIVVEGKHNSANI